MLLHIAILKNKYLDLILNGGKKLECRLSRIKCPPFHKVTPGDRIHLKESGGLIRGEATVNKVLFLEHLTSSDIRNIRDKYNDLILAEPAF